jgi:putative holliday junction resolvase
MGRVLAIDYGKKRVGIAVTDRLRIIASPLATIPVGEIEKFLFDYLKRETVDEFVVGYPVQLNNLPSESVKYIEPFIRRLRKLFPDKPVHLIDERFTSKIAQKAILESGAGKKERMDKSIADRVSASLILQSFLERKSFNESKK